MQSPMQITGPLTVGEQLDRTFRILRQRIIPIAASAAVILLPVAILSVLFTGSFSSGYLALIEELSSGPQATPPISDVLPWMGFALGGGILVGMLTRIAIAFTLLVVAQHAFAANSSMALTVMQGIQQAWRRLLPYIGMIIIQSLAVTVFTIVALIPFLLILFIFGIGFEEFWGLVEPDNNSTAAIVALVGGIIIFLFSVLFLLLMSTIPLIYLSARWLAAMPALVNEGQGPIGALQRSWALTRGHVRRAIGLLILLFILEFVVGFPLNLFQQIVFILLPQPEVIFVLSGLVSFGAVLIWHPFYAVALVVIYLDLRVRSESLDLDARLTQLEAEVNA